MGYNKSSAKRKVHSTDSIKKSESSHVSNLKVQLKAVGKKKQSHQRGMEVME